MDNEYIYIGKIVNTHGIKGELRLLSDFKYKDKVFLENRKIYISEDYICETINTYRHHKIFDMITLKGYNNINQVLKYLNQTVYVKRNDLLLNDDEFLDKDIINLNIVFDNKEVGRVLAIKKVGNNNKIIEAIINDKKILIPYHKDFIKKVDINSGIIEMNLIGGMIWWK